MRLIILVYTGGFMPYALHFALAVLQRTLHPGLNVLSRTRDEPPLIATTPGFVFNYEIASWEQEGRATTSSFATIISPPDLFNTRGYTNFFASKNVFKCLICHPALISMTEVCKIDHHMTRVFVLSLVLRNSSSRCLW